jgi:hypothetical protein
MIAPLTSLISGLLMIATPYQLPNICCSCAERQGTSFWTIIVSKLAGISHYIVALGIKRAGYSLQVPVCEECFEQLSSLEKRNKRVNYLLIALSFILRIYILFQTHILLTSILVSLLFYSIFSLLLKSHEAGKLGGYTGRYFWFSRREFFKQFAQLNPTLVNPYQYRRFFNS